MPEDSRGPFGQWPLNDSRVTIRLDQGPLSKSGKVERLCGFESHRHRQEGNRMARSLFGRQVRQKCQRGSTPRPSATEQSQILVSWGSLLNC